MTEVIETGPQKVLELVAQRVRLISDRQAAIEIFHNAARPLRVARTAIRRLERQGLLETLTVMVHPEPNLDGPILDWRPDDPLPNFDRIAWQLQSRWTEPLVRTMILWATPKAKRLAGALSAARTPRAREILHDIGVAQCYFAIQRTHPQLAEHWTGEDQLRAEGREGNIPDALIAAPDDKQIIVEFGGAYNARKVRGIHQNYAPQGRYQIW